MSTLLAVLLKRLEDSSDEVRLLAMGALATLTHCLDKDKLDSDGKELLVDVYETLLVHMDDAKEPVRKKALGNMWQQQ